VAWLLCANSGSLAEVAAWATIPAGRVGRMDLPIIRKVTFRAVDLLKDPSKEVVRPHHDYG
jgi:hypothetical protein